MRIHATCVVFCKSLSILGCNAQDGQYFSKFGFLKGKAKVSWGKADTHPKLGLLHMKNDPLKIVHFQVIREFADQKATKVAL